MAPSFQPQQKRPKTWYRTRGGKVFLGILGAFAILGTIFASIVGYYVVQIKQGKGLEIAKSLEEGNPLFTFTSGDETPPENRTYTDTEILSKIRPTNPHSGEDIAPVRIMMFIDFECPFCQRAYPVLREVQDQFGPAVQIVFKHFPIPSIHPGALSAAHASECAREQNKFWEYYQVLFEKKLYDENSLVEFAADLGMNTTQFTGCFRTQKYQTIIDQDLADGKSLGVRGTPTYFVNDTKVEGLRTRELWGKILLQELQP